MSIELYEKRSKLVTALKDLPTHMRKRVQELKAEGEALRNRSDLVWYLLLQSAATQGNSRGWQGLFKDELVFGSVTYAALAPLSKPERESQILAALRKAKVRMPTVKAPRLAVNVGRIEEMGGVEQATKRMLSLPTRDEKFRFMRSFDGIGEKYGRNIWMDIYDPAFRDTVAVDERLKKVAQALNFPARRYVDYEKFFCDMARDAGLEPWELDRLLYQFTDHFLAAVQ